MTYQLDGIECMAKSPDCPFERNGSGRKRMRRRARPTGMGRGFQPHPSGRLGALYANFDARQAAIYGRLIESFGRSRVRTYCCSNEMVDAVARGDILLAYNVQLSYAYAAAFVQSLITASGQAVAKGHIAPPPGALTLGTVLETERAS